MLGRRYSFLSYFNSMLGPTLGVYVEPRFITVVNVAQVDLGFLFYAWLSERSRDPTLTAISWSLALVNSVLGHLVPALVMGAYNPGALQSVLMAPAAVYFLYRTFKSKGARTVAVALFAGSIYGHGLALVVPAILTSKGVLSNWGHLVWVIAANLIPVTMIYPWRRRQDFGCHNQAGESVKSTKEA